VRALEHRFAPYQPSSPESLSSQSLDLAPRLHKARELNNFFACKPDAQLVRSRARARASLLRAHAYGKRFDTVETAQRVDR
jgi:hypothetical protein